MIPVYIYDPSVPLPTDSNFYVVAGNGIFFHKSTGIVSCFIKVQDIPVLEELKDPEWVKTTLPQIPLSIISKVKYFFAQVYARYQSEVNVILYFNKESSEYLVYMPYQKVTKTSVVYDFAAANQEMAKHEGFRPIGTIHSHCDFESFHSNVDVEDERFFDGVHLTFGHNDQKEFSITASVVVNGKRQKFEPKSLLQGIVKISERYQLPVEEVCDIEDWFEKIVPEQGFVPDPKLKIGDRITWSEYTSPCWPDLYGIGPFEVIRVIDGVVPNIEFSGTTPQGDKSEPLPAFLFTRRW